MSAKNTYPWGHLTTNDKPKAVKVRLAECMKVVDPATNEPEKAVAIMGQMRSLTHKDLCDFAGWFNEAGYPTLDVPPEVGAAA